MQDPQRFVSYYERQVGGALPGFAGAPVMYGRGIGSLFSRLFRFVSPLVKRGFALAKPHLTSAAKNIASDVMTHAAGKIFKNNQEEGVQEGAGGIMVLARRPRKRPPGQRLSKAKKRRRSGKKNSVGRSRSKRKVASSQDIF